jgi:hypothetical protein
MHHRPTEIHLKTAKTKTSPLPKTARMVIVVPEIVRAALNMRLQNERADNVSRRLGDTLTDILTAQLKPELHYLAEIRKAQKA